MRNYIINLIVNYILLLWCILLCTLFAFKYISFEIACIGLFATICSYLHFIITILNDD